MRILCNFVLGIMISCSAVANNNWVVEEEEYRLTVSYSGTSHSLTEIRCNHNWRIACYDNNLGVLSNTGIYNQINSLYGQFDFKLKSEIMSAISSLPLYNGAWVKNRDDVVKVIIEDYNRDGNINVKFGGFHLDVNAEFQYFVSPLSITAKLRSTSPLWFSASLDSNTGKIKNIGIDPGTKFSISYDRGWGTEIVRFVSSWFNGNSFIQSIENGVRNGIASINSGMLKPGSDLSLFNIKGFDQKLPSSFTYNLPIDVDSAFSRGVVDLVTGGEVKASISSRKDHYTNTVSLPSMSIEINAHDFDYGPVRIHFQEKVIMDRVCPQCQ